MIDLKYVAYTATEKAQKNYEINTVWASEQHQAGMTLCFWKAPSPIRGSWMMPKTEARTR